MKKNLLFDNNIEWANAVNEEILKINKLVQKLDNI